MWSINLYAMLEIRCTLFLSLYLYHILSFHVSSSARSQIPKWHFKLASHGSVIIILLFVERCYRLWRVNRRDSWRHANKNVFAVLNAFDDQHPSSSSPQHSSIHFHDDPNTTVLYYISNNNNNIRVTIKNIQRELKTIWMYIYMADYEEKCNGIPYDFSLSAIHTCCLEEKNDSERVRMGVESGRLAMSMNLMVLH